MRCALLLLNSLLMFAAVSSFAPTVARFGARRAAPVARLFSAPADQMPMVRVSKHSKIQS
jgi:hypothetical protein